MSTVLEARGGWWHDYVCPTHGVELGPAVGDGYPCPYGCTLSGEPFTGAWVVMEHQARAREARLLARRSRRGGATADRDRAVTTLCDFAGYYAEVVAGGASERAEAWMLKGKLFSQALTEAIWAVQIADAVRVLSTDEEARTVLAEPVGAMLRNLLQTVAEAWHHIVEVRDEPANNYVAWLDAAGAALCTALSALGEPVDEPVADACLWRERLLAHLALATDEDGWEWEGSTYYHLFVLRAYLLALQGADPPSVPAGARDRLAAMLAVLVRLAGPDGALPVLHDGPFDRAPAHLEVLEICALARQLWAQAPVEQIEGWVRHRLGASHDGLEDDLEAWFAGPPLPWPAPAGLRASTHFAARGYVVLRDPADTLTAILDAGPHGGSHGHLDKLGLYFYGDGVAWQPAPGVPPYGSPLRRGYYARTLAHPTVRVDGADQLQATGTVELLELDRPPGVGRVVANAGDAIDGVRVTREVVMTPSYLLDVVRVRVTGTEPAAEGDDAAPAEHDLTLALRPAVPLEVTAGAAVWRTTWHGPVGRDLHGIHRSTTPSALVASPGRGPSDDPAALRTIGDWAAHGSHTAFVSVYCVGDPRVADLELFTQDTGSALLTGVRIHLTDGTTTEHEVAR